MKHRVVITGMGCVSPYGIKPNGGTTALWSGLKEARTAIGPVPWLSEHKLQCQNGGAVLNYNPSDHFSLGCQMLFDRATQFALLSCQEAWQQAGISSDDPILNNAAVVMGTGVGGADALHQAYHELYAQQLPTVAPLTVPRAMAHAPASHIALRFNAKGPALTLSTACASSTQAIGEAFRWVRSGYVPLAFAGGCDAALNPLVWRAWESLRAMAPDTCRPFSIDRKGMILGEGAGVLILETLENAKQRGATIFAEVLGYAQNCNSLDLVKPSAVGAAQAMRDAIGDAGIGIHDVSYINAHGTGTPLNDRAESEAIQMVFDKTTDALVVSSVKSAIGHLMGASGVVEVIASLMAFLENTSPPTLNYSGECPHCPLNYSANQTTHGDYRFMVKNSLAFGGLNASLVLGRAHS